MSGLNDGLELEDELEEQIYPRFSQILFEDPKAGEVPDIDQDTAVVTTVNGLKDLNYLHTDIVKSKGMTAGFAMEAERLIPGFLSEDRPLGFFTQYPTKTQYQASLEAIDAQSKSIVQRIVEAVQALMAQAVQWLSSTIERLRGAADDQVVESFFKHKDSKSVMLLQHIQKTYEDVDAAVAKADSLVKDKKAPEAQAYSTALKERLAKADERMRELYDQINSNDAVYAIVANPQLVERVLKVCESGGQAVHALADFQKIATELILAVKIKSHNVAPTLKQVRERAAGIVQMNGGKSYEATSRAMKLDLTNRLAKVTPQSMPLPKLAERLRAVFPQGDVKALAHQLGQLHSEVDAMQKASAGMTKDSAWSLTGADRQVINEMAEAFRAINGELRGLLTTVKMASDFYASWLWLVKVVEGFFSDYSKRVSVHLKDLDEESQKALTDYFGLPDAA